MIGRKFPLGVSLFLVFSLIFVVNLTSPDAFFGDITSLNRGEIIGGEITEIVSAPEAILSAQTRRSIFSWSGVTRRVPKKTR